MRERGEGVCPLCYDTYSLRLDGKIKAHKPCGNQIPLINDPLVAILSLENEFILSRMPGSCDWCWKNFTDGDRVKEISKDQWICVQCVDDMEKGNPDSYVRNR